jgi:hypothetical protein
MKEEAVGVWGIEPVENLRAFGPPELDDWWYDGTSSGCSRNGQSGLHGRRRYILLDCRNLST